MRWRLVIIAWRKDLGIPAGYGFPAPTHGGEIGDLLPNCTITPSQSAGFLTTHDAIADLPAVEAGEETGRYVGPPTTAYQHEMRAGLTDELWNHYAAKLSAPNLERIALLKPGEDWRDLPRELLPSGMQRALRKDHTRRYRRMTWDGVPRTIVTRFRDPKTGEYSSIAGDLDRRSSRRRGSCERITEASDTPKRPWRTSPPEDLPLRSAGPDGCDSAGFLKHVDRTIYGDDRDEWLNATDPIRFARRL